jgi:hypothetical protein
MLQAQEVVQGNEQEPVQGNEQEARKGIIVYIYHCGICSRKISKKNRIFGEFSHRDIIN